MGRYIFFNLEEAMYQSLETFVRRMIEYHKKMEDFDDFMFLFDTHKETNKMLDEFYNNVENKKLIALLKQ